MAVVYESDPKYDSGYKMCLDGCYKNRKRLSQDFGHLNTLYLDSARVGITP